MLGKERAKVTVVNAGPSEGGGLCGTGAPSFPLPLWTPTPHTHSLTGREDNERARSLRICARYPDIWNLGQLFSLSLPSPSSIYLSSSTFTLSISLPTVHITLPSPPHLSPWWVLVSVSSVPTTFHHKICIVHDGNSPKWEDCHHSASTPGRSQWLLSLASKLSEVRLLTIFGASV